VYRVDAHYDDLSSIFIGLDDVTRRPARVDQNYAPAVIDSHDAEGQDRDQDPNMRRREK
jgi:hypothetical protein